MPNLTYAYVTRAAIVFPGVDTCPGGPAAALIALPNPIVPTWPQLFNAQLIIGVYPAGWVIHEARWRVSSLRVAAQVVGVNLAPSPVVAQMDPTEKGQLSYHVGTAAGLYLAMNSLNAGAGNNYFPYLFSRAEQQGAALALQNGPNGSRPDLLLLCVGLPAMAGGPAVFHNFVPWECKGHGVANGQAPLGPALQQSQQVVNMTVLPGNIALGVPAVPIAVVASQIDVYFNNYRMQTIDPDQTAGGSQNLMDTQANDFVWSFYSPFIEIIDQSSGQAPVQLGKINFRTFELIPKVFFAIDERIYYLFKNPPSDLAYQVGQLIKEGYDNSNPDEYWINAFGIGAVLNVGWKEA